MAYNRYNVGYFHREQILGSMVAFKEQDYDRRSVSNENWLSWMISCSIQSLTKASGVACWVYVQKYVKHKILDEMPQEWSGAIQFILAMDTWCERLIAE